MSRVELDCPSVSGPRPWRPIVHGAARERCDAFIDSVVASLSRIEDVPSALSTLPSDASIASGSAGVALLLAYLAWTRQSETDVNRSVQILGRAVEAVGANETAPGLFAGFTGVAWVVEHLRGWLLDPDDEDPNEAVDGAVSSILIRRPWRGDFDLISGLVGLGVYALERLPHPVAAESLERIVSHLGETAEADGPGVTWWTSPDLLPVVRRKELPQGFYNLGVAHGVAGVVLLLSRIFASGIARSQAGALVSGAVAWLLAQRLPPGSLSRFPGYIAAGAPAASRLAWCHGDLGIAAALLAAARCVDEPLWEQAAIELALGAAARSTEGSGVVDASLCHGAAGVGHLFNRLYQATGHLTLREAACRWFDEAIGMLAAKRNETPSPGFLEGSAGIALALLAGTTNTEPRWDAVLLASAPASGSNEGS